ncbi:unnamed protein product, partial [Discosporangium mesarthrocarpum]
MGLIVVLRKAFSAVRFLGLPSSRTLQASSEGCGRQELIFMVPGDGERQLSQPEGSDPPVLPHGHQTTGAGMDGGFPSEDEDDDFRHLSTDAEGFSSAEEEETGSDLGVRQREAMMMMGVCGGGGGGELRSDGANAVALRCPAPSPEPSRLSKQLSLRRMKPLHIEIANRASTPPPPAPPPKLGFLTSVRRGRGWGRGKAAGKGDVEEGVKAEEIG